MRERACVRACVRVRGSQPRTSPRPRRHRGGYIKTHEWYWRLKWERRDRESHDRTHTDRCQKRSCWKNALTNVVPPSQPYRDKMRNTL